MSGFLTAMADLAAENVLVTSGVLLFLAVATITVAVTGAMQSRGEMRRRAASIAQDGPAGQAGQGIRRGGLEAMRRLVGYVDRHFVPTERTQITTLRRQLMQAGYLGRQAPAWFFLSRIAAALALGAAALTGAPALMPDIQLASLWLVTGGAAMTGYILPSFYIGKRATSLQDQHRVGFPDFMDLMVVCADAGLSMEAAIERVGRELAEGYPSLSANLYMATLEMRAGRSMGEALEHLGDRLGIEEGRSFATLLQQSEELGSSLTEALRVYSDEMRHKRLSRAEEKAYSLPAKLVVPLGLCIFPVLFVVTLLPVVVRVRAHF